MAIDPAIAGLGSAGIFALGCAILKYGPSLPAKESKFCEDHHHLVDTVDELKKDMKTSTDKLHQRLDEAVKTLYRIEGRMQESAK